MCNLSQEEQVALDSYEKKLREGNGWAAQGKKGNSVWLLNDYLRLYVWYYEGNIKDSSCYYSELQERLYRGGKWSLILKAVSLTEEEAKEMALKLCLEYQKRVRELVVDVKSE